MARQQFALVPASKADGPDTSGQASTQVRTLSRSGCTRPGWSSGDCAGSSSREQRVWRRVWESHHRSTGQLKTAEAQNRTLYSLRHTYATLALLEGEVDIHTLSRQMGNSAAMIERHYSKLTATMAADRLA